ncbi:hypothetical protein IC229_28805 [Spirosoma sp. BT702]|uniref:Uncharacterized protein n=1 Tax=Spirosoma profusum TaxID=2771354 RepID=A0A926Y201_9BACT|nr:hypothetical protein [Spirosoma profusum]MBD2704671.1 hypothetical protein [Spirosoma profusum]
MEKKNGEDKNYPAEYAHLGRKVAATKERIQQLDQQIQSVPQNSKPAPRLQPPGFTQPRYFNRERTIGSIEQQKADLKADTFTQVEQEVREADAKTARQVRDVARESLYPNPFKRMDAKEKNSYHSKPKDMERSQDYMDTMFKASKTEPKKEEQTKADTKPISMSMRFSQSLSYSKVGEKTDKSPDRGKDMERD